MPPPPITKMDNGVFWLGKDARGQGIVYRANGYTGTRVSTHAVEWQIQRYGDMSDAIGYAYQQDGHTFYVLTFPSADATWVYDAATKHGMRGQRFPMADSLAIAATASRSSRGSVGRRPSERQRSFTRPRHLFRQRGCSEMAAVVASVSHWTEHPEALRASQSSQLTWK